MMKEPEEDWAFSEWKNLGFLPPAEEGTVGPSSKELYLESYHGDTLYHGRISNILYLAITHDLEPIAHGIDSPRLNKKDLTNTI